MIFVMGSIYSSNKNFVFRGNADDDGGGDAEEGHHQAVRGEAGCHPECHYQVCTSC